MTIQWPLNPVVRLEWDVLNGVCLVQCPDSKVHGANLGPVGPRWAPCWPHDPFYQGGYLKHTQIAKFMGPTWGPPGSCWPQMGPMNLVIRAAAWNPLIHSSLHSPINTDCRSFRLYFLAHSHRSTASRKCEMNHSTAVVDHNKILWPRKTKGKYENW